MTANSLREYGPIRLLVVDDDPADRTLMRIALQGTNTDIELKEAKTGVEAIHFLKTKTKDWFPSAILLDLNMPGLSGLDVLEAIKRNDRLKCIPVLIFSSSDRPADIKQAYESYASAYLQKPNNPKELHDFARGLLQAISIKAIRLPVTSQ